MITVVTAAQSKRLTTVEAVRQEIGITDAAKDGLIETWIDRASELIVGYCNRELARETVTETVPGFATQLLRLTRRPVVSIASVTLTLADGSTETIDEDDYSLRPNGVFRRDGWQWTARQVFGALERRRAGSEEDAYTVTYDGGWICPGITGRDLPHDLEQACIEIVRAQYGNRARDPRVSEVSIYGGYGEKIEMTVGVIPPAALGILYRYKASLL